MLFITPVKRVIHDSGHPLSSCSRRRKRGNTFYFRWRSPMTAWRASRLTQQRRLLKSSQNSPIKLVWKTRSGFLFSSQFFTR